MATLNNLDDILFPQIEPFHSEFVQVSDLHTLYVEQCGNAQGIPVVFLHGGPGGNCEPGHRRFFNPEEYRIILFDQRGCGKSKPHASLEENTTWDLIEDLEKRNVEMERFTYTVSHDLKSPLITIRGFLGLLEQDVIGGNIERAKGDIARIMSITRFHAIVLGSIPKFLVLDCMLLSTKADNKLLAFSIAEFIAAQIKSSSISFSSMLIKSFSISIFNIFNDPLALTVTIPPPELASTKIFSKSACDIFMSSCIFLACSIILLKSNFMIFSQRR